MGWEKHLTEKEREKLTRVDESGKFWAVESPVLDGFARSLAASRALVEARTKVMEPLRPVIANAAEYYADDYWSERLAVGHFFGAITLGDVRAMITALARTEADFMEAE